MKLTDIILKEQPGKRQLTVNLQDLTFDTLLSAFGKKPMFGFSLPNPDDSSTMIHDDEALDRWKANVSNKYGNVNIRIDSEASSQWDQIQVLDDKFRQDKKDYTARKGAWLDSERQAGRSSGLD